jgi:DNA-binding Lrp family transcriptional regulator
MTNAIVLVDAERNSMLEVGPALAALDGVSEVFSVSGEWDFVAIVRVPKTERLANVVSKEIGSIPGVTRTHTMVAFESFSSSGDSAPNPDSAND